MLSTAQYLVSRRWYLAVDEQRQPANYQRSLAKGGLAV